MNFLPSDFREVFTFYFFRNFCDPGEEEMEGPSIDFSLYLITDRHQTQGRNLLKVVQEAIDGGVQAVQLREKDLCPRDLYNLAVSLRLMTHKAGVRLFINDRVDLAMAVNADGVHLRSDSFPISTVRKIIGRTKRIGVSTHSLREVREAEKEGADFVTLGPIYYTPSKGPFGKPLGPLVIEEVKKESHIPIFALGGITIARVSDVMNRGSEGIGVISAILGSHAVKKNTDGFRKAIQPFLKNEVEV